MTREEIIESIAEEYKSFKEHLMNAGINKVWENAFEITAWTALNDYFQDCCEELTDKEMDSLYRKSNGRTLYCLYGLYMKSEFCNIDRYDDIHDLITDYLQEC